MIPSGLSWAGCMVGWSTGGGGSVCIYALAIVEEPIIYTACGTLSMLPASQQQCMYDFSACPQSRMRPGRGKLYATL